MRKLLAVALVLAIIGVSGSALAQTKVRSWDDLSWWGNSEATPEPVRDATRAGYWWWPTEPASNVDDLELWGNRGVVYHLWMPPPPPPPAPLKPPAKVDVPPLQIQRSVPVFSHVLFEFDKSNLKPEGEREVDKAVALMNSNPGDTLVIEGHTCNVGTDEYNMGLGQRRADAVKDYMAANGISASRLGAQSKGESQPAVSNDTPANRKLNRRAVFKYTIRN